MANRRGSQRTSSTVSSRRGGRGRIQKATRSRQVPQRYGQSQELEPSQSESEDTLQQEATSEEVETSEYADSHTGNQEPQTPTNSTRSTIQGPARVLIPPSARDISLSPAQAAIPGISLDDMRNLLKSHEQGIIDRVVRQLQTANHNPLSLPTHHVLPQQELQPPTLQSAGNPTMNRICELENQLAQLRAET